MTFVKGKTYSKIVRIRAIKHLEGVFPEYQPVVGKVYEAEWFPCRRHTTGHDTGSKAFCLVDIKDKRIALRCGEFEFVGDEEDG